MMRVGPLLRNVGALVVSQAFTKLVNIAVSLVLVRWLGPAELGQYAYILAFCYPFGALTDFGIGTLAIREISQDRSREPQIVTAVSRLLVVLACSSIPAMLGIATLTRHDTRTLLGILVAGLSSPLSALTTPSLIALTAREQFHYLSLFQLLRSALGSLVTFGILMAGGTAIPILLGDAVSNGIMLLVARHLEGRRPAAPPTPPGVYRSLLRQAVPFGLVLVGFTLYYRLDMLMLGWFRDAREVGRYAAAYRFLDVLLILGATLTGPLYPRLSSLVGRDPGGIRAILATSWCMMAGLGIPLAVGATLLAGPLTVTLFGAAYRDTAGLVRILIWAGVPILLVTVPGHVLNAIDRVWYLAGVFWTSTAANLALNLVLIPRLGAEGAAVATVACTWLTLGLVIRSIRLDLGVALPWLGLWRYGLAALLMAGILILARVENLALAILVGVAGYAISLVLLGYLWSQDFRSACALLRQ